MISKSGLTCKRLKTLSNRNPWSPVAVVCRSPGFPHYDAGNLSDVVYLSNPDRLAGQQSPSGLFGPRGSLQGVVTVDCCVMSQPQITYEGED